MAKQLLGICAVFVVAMGAGAGGPIEIPLSFEVMSVEQTGMLRGGTSAQPVMREIEAPSDRAVVFRFSIHETDHYFAIEDDESGENNLRLYFDANGNKDLSDDSFISGEIKQVNERVILNSFGPVEMEYQMDGQTLPYAVNIMHIGVKDGPAGMNPSPCTVLSAGVWAGKFEANGQTYNIWFADGNFDGSCRPGLNHVHIERAPDMLHFSGDMFSVSTENLATASFGAMIIPERLVIGNELYSIEVRIAERRAILTPLDVPVVPVTAPDGLRQALLVTEDMKSGLVLIDPPEIVHLPEGRYHVAGYQDVKKDEQGDTWSLMAMGDKTAPMVTADGSDDARIGVGSPYSAKIAGGDLRGDPQISFGIQGQGKERVVLIRRTEGTSTRHKLSEAQENMPAEPAFRVVTEEGEVVASGVMEYG